MGWLLAGWSLSVSWLVAVNDYQETLDNASTLTSDYSSCSNDFFNDLLQVVSYDPKAYKTDLLIWYIVLGLFCFILWPTMFCANWKLVTE